MPHASWGTAGAEQRAYWAEHGCNAHINAAELAASARQAGQNSELSRGPLCAEHAVGGGAAAGDSIRYAAQSRREMERERALACAAAWDSQPNSGNNMVIYGD